MIRIAAFCLIIRGWREETEVVYSVSFPDPYIFNKAGVGLYSDFRGGSTFWQNWAHFETVFFLPNFATPPKITIYAHPPH
jgi:hypothetical protein